MRFSVGDGEHCDRGSRKLREPAQEQAEVRAGGRQRRIDAVAVAALAVAAGRAE